MKFVPTMSLTVMLLCGCTPGGKTPSASGGPTAQGPSVAAAAPAVRTAAPTVTAPSYEVSIASAQADRVHARDECDSKPKPARASCFQAADATYDEAKSAAEKVRDALP